MSTAIPESLPTSPPVAPVDLSFLERVIAATPGVPRLEMCIQCGTCSGSCPSGADMLHTPRQLFAMIRAGMRDQVLSSNTPWLCVSCYYCMARCPQQVHVTDIMYTLKRMAVRSKMTDDSTAPDFSKTFIDWVENYGHAFELGLMSQHMLRHNPFGVFKIADMGVGMVTKGRISFTPKRIKSIDGLKAILAKAKELEAQDAV
ncbi:MAG: 4Fe-4S dicluster domain-containing protein [Chloroflexi bacterium]|nr:4Fe-4S dicluster domain-containing protein [Chloroflexota bacterium]